MTENKNFKWLVNDIDSTLVLKVISKNKSDEITYGIFNVIDILETDGDKLDVTTGNIDDLTNLLSLGIVRFVNMSDSSDILDIPFRKLKMIYDNANILGDELSGRFMSFRELEIFSVIDDVIRDDLLVLSSVIDDCSDDFMEVMTIASKFIDYDMQGKFDAMSRVTYINHNRLVEEEMDRSYK